MPTVRPQYRQAFRVAILDAARESFARHGYEGFSMRQLARNLGCSHGNLYLYFPSKQQLFDGLVEESFAQLSQALQQLQTRSDDPVMLLKQAGRIYIQFGLDNPQVYEFAFVLRRSGPMRPHKPHAAFRFLRSVVQRCIEEKRFRALDVDTAAQAIWSAVHGLVALLIARPTFPWVDEEELINLVIDNAVDSLMVASAAKPKPRVLARPRARGAANRPTALGSTSRGRR